MSKLENNKGFTQADIVVSICILMLFVTLIASLFYNSYISSTANKRNAEASVYLSQIFEAIDLIDYDELEDEQEGIVAKINKIDEQKISAQYVENSSAENKLTTPYKIYVEVTNKIESYNNNESISNGVGVASLGDPNNNNNVNSKQEDLIKIITLTIKYNINQKEQTISAKRIKIRELPYEDSSEIMPNLLDGMLPLTNEEDAKITTKYSSDWFDYSNAKPAQVTLQDVLSMDINRKNRDSRQSICIYTKICI